MDKQHVLKLISYEIEKQENIRLKVTQNSIKYHKAKVRRDTYSRCLSLIKKIEMDSKFSMLPEPTPIEVIEYYIEQRGLKAKDLVGILGDKTTVSKIMNNERKLNLGMIRRLHDKAKIPYDLLIREY